MTGIKISMNTEMVYNDLLPEICNSIQQKYLNTAYEYNVTIYNKT